MSSPLFIHSYDSIQKQELLETDLSLLRDLRSTFEGMLDALGDENQEDRYFFFVLHAKYSIDSYLD